MPIAIFVILWESSEAHKSEQGDTNSRQLIGGS